MAVTADMVALATNEVPGPGSVNSPLPVLDLDSFPVGIAVRGIRRQHAIAYTVLYGLLFLFVLTRLICTSRPKHAHRRGAYICLAFMAMFRVPLFALGTVLVDRIASGKGSNWGIVCSMDLLSILGFSLFCAALFSLCYSWSGRIPCCYCMVQFKDNPHILKACAIYVIPLLSATLCVVGSVLRTVSVTPAGLTNDTLYRQGTKLARGGTIISFFFVASLSIMLPYTAIIRYRTLRRDTREDVDHTAVADMVLNQRIEEATSVTTSRAFTTLFIVGCTLLPGGIWRILLMQTTKLHYTDPLPWVRTPAALGVLTVMFEVFALLVICLLNFEDLDTGNVEIWNPRVCRERMSRRKQFEDSKVVRRTSTVYLDDISRVTPSKSPREKMFESTAELVQSRSVSRGH